VGCSGLVYADGLIEGEVHQLVRGEAGFWVRCHRALPRMRPTVHASTVRREPEVHARKRSSTPKARADTIAPSHANTRT
jgi:hypothetical protein